MSSSMNQAREMNTNTILSPPSSSAMSTSLQEEHELRPAQEMSGEQSTRTVSSATNDQANKNLRGTQRTSGMPVSVVYQVVDAFR